MYSCKGKVLRAGEVGYSFIPYAAPTYIPRQPDWNIVQVPTFFEIRYYSAHMVFDLIACATATYFIVYSSRIQGVIHFSKLFRSILRDGLLYFIVVFLVNFWVVLEFANVFKSGAASSLPLAVVLIAVQHLVLNTQRLISPARPSVDDRFNGELVSQGPPQFYENSRTLDGVELESGVFAGGDTFAGTQRDQKESFN
ncbi:hypothetical protein C8R43DRAFT_944043 [Mycena crocata]|nr:hypothetical protein C8R43DRAFT_944043 [Mycena crocata]